MNKLLVPKLRFPEFDGEWDLQQLGNITKIYDGTHMTPDYKENGIPFYSVEHVTNDDFSQTKFIAEDVFEKENKRVMLEKGDVLMTRIGDIGTSKYISWDVKASFYVSLALLKGSRDDSMLFVNQYIKTNIFQKELHKRTIHVAFPKKINLGEIGLCNILLPRIDEQTKIANFLTAVDDKIQQLTRKKELLEQYKKGVMQQIFSQKIRFKDDDGSDYPVWEEKKLGDVIDCLDNKRIPINAEERLKIKGSIPYYGANGVVDWISKFIFDEQLVLLAEDGGNFDEFSTRPIAQLISGKSWVNNHAHVIKANVENHTPFIFYTLVHKDIRQWINGTSRSKLNKSDMFLINLQLPNVLEEQQKIAGILSIVDDKIDMVLKQLQQTQIYKNSLLQQMFI